MSDAWRFSNGLADAGHRLAIQKADLRRRGKVYESFLRDMGRLGDDALDPQDRQRTLAVIARQLKEHETEQLLVASSLDGGTRGFVRAFVSAGRPLRQRILYVLTLLSPRPAFAAMALLAK